MKPPSAPLASRARPVSRTRQRGAAGIIIAMLLTFLMAAAVLGMLSISGSSVMDAGNNEQQISALFLAESGLERGQATVAAAPSITNAVCTGVGAGGPFALGSGTFTLIGTSYAFGSVPPNNPNTPCDNSGGTPCGNCVLTATGILGANTRTVSRTLSLTTVNGASCNASTAVPDCTNATASPPTTPPTWQLTLKNTFANNAIALFDLAFLRQGNPTGAACTSAGCALMWNVNANNGSNSVGGMGNAVTISAGATQSIYQTLSLSKNLAEVGALFPGSGAGGPSIVGATAYWDDTNPNGGGTKTVGRAADSNGQTNNGTANTVTTCSAPGSNSAQSCNSWCLAGDTLVFGFAAHSSSGLSDTLSGVTFNTAGAQANNIALSRIAKFPNTTIAGAPPDVYSEVWYAHNPNLSSPASPSAQYASSYKGIGSATIGASFTGRVTAAGATLTVSGIGAGQIISLNDSIYNGINMVGTITGFGTGTGGNGTYTSDNSGGLGNINSTPMTTRSQILNVWACSTTTSICNFANGDNLNSFGGISSSASINGAQLTLRPGEFVGGIGRYPISSAATTVATAAVRAGTPGTTIYLPSGQSMPTVTTPNTIISIIPGAGSGAFSNAGATTVTAVNLPTLNGVQSFTVSPAPSTPLALAIICGGTCAFFDQTSATTTFAINKSTAPGTDNWAAGFMCLSGADITPISISSSTVQPTDWYEAVR